MSTNETSIKCSCEPAQLAAYKAAAKKDGRTMASWIRYRLDQAAKAPAPREWRDAAKRDGFEHVADWLQWLGDDNAAQHR